MIRLQASFQKPSIPDEPSSVHEPSHLNDLQSIILSHRHEIRREGPSDLFVSIVNFEETQASYAHLRYPEQFNFINAVYICH